MENFHDVLRGHLAPGHEQNGSKCAGRDQESTRVLGIPVKLRKFSLISPKFISGLELLPIPANWNVIKIHTSLPDLRSTQNDTISIKKRNFLETVISRM